MALDFFAGCIGGCVGVLVGHPFDTIKVRMQIQSGKTLYTGTIHAFKCIIKKESVFGLYKGMASPMYGLAAINAVVFGVQGNVQRRMNNPDSLRTHFAAGSVAGMAQTFICSPMELAKTRMQIQGQGESRQFYRKTKHSYTGPVDCIAKIYKHEGVRGVFRGFWLTLLRETPSFGMYFVAYKVMCRAFTNEEDDVAMPVLLLAGGCAGMASWLSTYPVDVIKSRIQADMKGQYKSVMDCLRQSYKEEGMMLFTRGLGPTMIRAFPVNAATFTTVALILRTFRKEEDDDAINFSELEHHHRGPKHTRWHIAMISNFPSHP